MKSKARRLSATVTWLFLLAVTPAVLAAPPRVYMFYGEHLSQPVLLTDWQENLRLNLAILSGESVSSKELAERPHIEIALYWGSGWERYLGNSELHPQQADQKGKFYPAVGDAAPVIALEVGVPHRLSPEGVEILVRHGIPVRLEEPFSAKGHERNVLLAFVALICLSVLGGVMFLIRRRLLNRRSV